jgi:two-component system chemotaxis sensor kinase CheA
MDVVRKTIDMLRGVIEVESERGSGTLVTLKLPLTLAIIDGLLTKVGDSFFVLPLSTVEECIELTHKTDEKRNGNCLVNVRGQLVPYIRLRETFGMEGGLPHVEQIIITEAGGDRIGFVVDHVIGEHQTVIKSLGKVYKHIDGISGATILGDGTVALILDTNRLSTAA